MDGPGANCDPPRLDVGSCTVEGTSLEYWVLLPVERGLSTSCAGAGVISGAQVRLPSAEKQKSPLSPVLFSSLPAMDGRFGFFADDFCQLLLDSGSREMGRVKDVDGEEEVFTSFKFF